MRKLIFSAIVLVLGFQFCYADDATKNTVKPITTKLGDGSEYDLYLPLIMPKEQKLPLYYIFSYSNEGNMLAKPLQAMVAESKIGLVHLKNLRSIMSIGKLRTKFNLTQQDIQKKYSFHPQRTYFIGLKSGAAISMAVAKWSKQSIVGLLLVDGCHMPVEGHPIVNSKIYSFGRKDGKGLRDLTNLKKRLHEYDLTFEIKIFAGESEVPVIKDLRKALVWFDKEWIRYADDITVYGGLRRKRLAVTEFKKISKLKSKKKFDVIYSQFEIFLMDFGNSQDPAIQSLLRKAKKKMENYSSKPDVMALFKYRRIAELIKEVPKNFINISDAITQLKNIVNLHPDTLAFDKSTKDIKYWETYMKQRKIYVPMISNEEVIKQYLAYVEKEVKGDRDKKLIKQLHINSQQSKQITEFIPNSLMVLNSSYQKGMISFGSNKMKTAKKYFTNVTFEKNKFLQAYRQYYLARIHIIRGNYEEAEQMLEELLKGNIKYTTHKEDAFFLLAISLFKQFKRSESEALFNEFLKRFPDSPERMIVGAAQMIDRIRAYEEGSLTDVEERMEYSKRKIRLSDMGEDSVENQKKIVAILEKLIKEAEQQEKDQRKRNRENQAKGGASPSNPSRPAEESQAPEGESLIGDLKKFSRGKRNEMWGKARKKEREKVLNNLKEKFPERYRQLIEQYFKGLQKDDE